MAILTSSNITIMVSSLTGEKVLSAVAKVLRADSDILEREFDQLEKLAPHVDLFRDAAGRLASVKVSVPSELVDTVKPHLLAIPGVIDIAVGDETPVGMIGIDGTTVPLTKAFKAFGVSVTTSCHSVLTETTDGDVSNSVFDGSDTGKICIAGPDSKHKMPGDGSVARLIASIEILGDNPSWLLSMSNKNGHGGVLSVAGGTASFGSLTWAVTGGIHSYDIRIKNSGAQAEIRVDGVSKGTVDAVSVHDSGTFRLYASAAHGINLDNWSWTPHL